MFIAKPLPHIRIRKDVIKLNNKKEKKKISVYTCRIYLNYLLIKKFYL